MTDSISAEKQLASANVIIEFLEKHPDTKLKETLLFQASNMIDSAAINYGMPVPWRTTVH